MNNLAAELTGKSGIFSYKSKIGILMLDSDVLDYGINSENLESVGNISFVPLQALTENAIRDIADGRYKPETTYTNSYAGILSTDIVEIKDAIIRNIENDQRLVNAWETLEEATEDEFIREYGVITDGYFDWTSEAKRLSDRIFSIYEDHNDDDEYISYSLSEERVKWEKSISAHPDLALGFDDILSSARGN